MDDIVKKMNALNEGTMMETLGIEYLEVREGYVYARMCTYSDETATAQFKPFVGAVDAQTDLLGNVTETIADGTMTFRPWEIKTVRIKL